MQLKDFDLFSGLATELLDDMATRFRQREIRAGQVLMEQGDPGDSVFLVVAGQLISALWTRDGREIAFRTLDPGAVIGELAVITSGPRSLSLYAHVDSILIEIPGPHFLRLIDDHHSIRDALMHRMVGMIRDLTQRVHELRTLRVQDRLRAYLLRTALDQGPLTPDMLLQHPHSHAHVGDMIGANREAVSRGLAALKLEGAIDYGRGFIRILEPAALMTTDMR